MTKENTKFKDALDTIGIARYMDPRVNQLYEVLRLALRLADRLTMEPSEAMLMAAEPALKDVNGAICLAAMRGHEIRYFDDKPPLYHAYKAMTDQLFKELDEEM